MLKKIEAVTTNIKYSFSIAYSISPKYFIYKVIATFIESTTSVILLYLWSRIINSLSERGSIHHIVLLFSLYTLMLFFQTIKSSVDNYIYERYGDDVEFYKSEKNIDLVSSLEIEQLEDKNVQDSLQNARGGFDSITEITWTCFSVVSRVITCVSAAAALAVSCKVILIPVILLIIPYIVCNKKYTELKNSISEDQTGESRLMDYYIGAASGSENTIENRLYGIFPIFIKKYGDLYIKLHDVRIKEDKKYLFRAAGLYILSILNDGLIAVITIQNIRLGIAEIGDIQYNLDLVNALSEALTCLFGDINLFELQNHKLLLLLDFIKQNTGDKSKCRDAKLIQSELNGRKQCPEIRFENVSFRYPSTDKDVIKDCSFIIKPGEHIAIVGKNGCGKSTIVKLILGLYKPTSGRILINNKDISEYDSTEIRKLYSVLFQECVPYYFKLREAIALSDYSRKDNDEELDNASVNSGFDSVIESWEKKYDCYLGRYLCDDGKDLSGGQWSLIGLSRAYFRDTGFYILDEPSAALDPITENNIFHKFDTMCKNKGAIMISHRLSGMRYMNRILVLCDGKIAENGTHRELLDKKGIYADMYLKQSSRYTE